MSAQNGTYGVSLFLHRLRTFHARKQAEHDYENVFLRSKHDILKLLGKPLGEASVLVLGCGYNYPEVALYSGIAGHACGLDVLEAFYRDGILKTYRAHRKSSSRLAAFLKALLFRFRYRRYYAHLERVAGVRISHDRYDLRPYDGLHMPFDDETFDAVISNAVLQHLADFDQVAREVHRVTKRGGVTYHLWHNYYSLSGGHMPEPVALQSPWGHLRGLHTQGNIYLNRFKPDEIRRVFSQVFAIDALYGVDRAHRKKGVDGDFAQEHPELLTSAIREELRAYPDELLLTRSYLLIGRKGG